jgi:CDP-diacylglycerol--serine O-phosphatidyltransferase
MNMTRQLPNALTLLNLCLGTAAIIALLNDQIPVALYLMGGCLIADMSDGLIARLLKVESNLGAHLDSLADVISFGVLPGMMIYFLGTKYGTAVPGKTITEILTVLMAASAGLRLARFNIDTRDRKYFWGYGQIL